jgi:hypothetical protein
VSSSDPDPGIERLLQDDGGEYGTLYRRLPRLEPPRRLDRAVLGEAARAVRGQAPRRQRWIVGLGSAAGLVLAAGIAWQVGQEALRQPASLPARPPSSEVVPVQPIEEAARAPAPAASPDVAAPPREPAVGPASPRQPARSAPAERMAPAQAQGDREPPLPMSVPAPPPAPPAPARPRSRTVSPPAGDAMAGARKAASAAARSGEGESLQAAREHASASPADLQRDLQRTPADWLAHIRELLQQGQRQQALQSLDLFRRTHPDQPVPDDLRALP